MNIYTLHSIEDTIKLILEKNKETRSNDRLLFLAYLEEVGYNTNKSVADFLLDENAPNMETIGRARRKIQETYPELQADAKTKAKRKEKEEVFTQYAWE